MADIKTREHSRDIKVLDKSLVAGERMKDAFIRSKDQAKEMTENRDASPSEYAENKMQLVAEGTALEVSRETKAQIDRKTEQGRKVFQERRMEARAQEKARRAEEALHRYDPELDVAANSAPSYRRGRDRVIKNAEKSKKTIKNTGKTTKEVSSKSTKAAVKSADKGIKTAKHTSKTAIKTAEETAKAAERTAQATAKAARASAQAARVTAKAAAASAKAIAKATAAMVKAIIAGLKSLIAAIAAGGWVAVAVITVICVIALVMGSCFGIFFSSEENGSQQTMYEVVREINDEYQQKIEEIKTENPYDELEMSGSRAVWPQVLSIYAVRMTTDRENAQEVATVTDEKKEILKEIFWEMNEIKHHTSTHTVTRVIETDDGNGNILEEIVEESIRTLRIVVGHKTADEMAEEYRFDTDQKEQLASLLDAENNSLWSNVLYGVYAADDQIVAVAYSQLGNVGGGPYWSWYGFGGRVEWCACFVSWCANECGYIDIGVIPKFALCSIGAQWFKDRGQWGDNSMEPAPGTIIFFDWDGDRDPDHVGIVEYTENGVVHTIEGNSGDMCRQRQYSVGNNQIYGYGLPAY